MTLEDILKDLIQQAPSKEVKYILFMLLKHANQVKLVEEKTEHLPLLFLQNDRVVLAYRDTEEDQLDYLFTNFEEILLILQKVFFSGSTLYFRFQKTCSPAEYKDLLHKIDEALSSNDKERFIQYTAQLKNLRKLF